MDDTITVSVGDVIGVHALKVRSDSGMYLDFCEPVCWFSAKSISLPCQASQGNLGLSYSGCEF